MDKKRYVAVIDIYVYAENDKEAIKDANELVNKINEHQPSCVAKIIKVSEQLFSSIESREVDLS